MLALAEGVSRAMEKIWWKRREDEEVEGGKSLVVRCEHGKRKCCRRWKRRMKWECAHSEVVEARKRRVVVLVAVVVVRVSCGKVVEIMSQLWVCVWQHVRRFVVVLQEHEDGEKDNKRRKPNVWCSPILSLPRLVVNLPSLGSTCQLALVGLPEGVVVSTRSMDSVVAGSDGLHDCLASQR